MHSSSSIRLSQSAVSAEINLRYVWMIAFVAALGGFRFGYDWVVIGGAKPFYEPFFHLTSEIQIGWANSCALIGSFLGSLIGGRVSDYLGRKRVLLAPALIHRIIRAYGVGILSRKVGSLQAVLRLETLLRAR